MNLSPIKVWSKLSGSSSTDIAHAMSVGLDGSIYISGLASGMLDGQTSSGAEDAFLTKYSTDGTKVWTKLLGTNAKDYALATATGLDGAIYIAGVTYGALDGQANSGDGDAFLTKYRTDGSKVWTTLLGGRLYDAAQGITVGLDGSIYITGQTLNSLDGQTNKGGADAFLTKYGSDGIKVWTKLLGTSEQTSSNFLGGKSWDEGHALTTGTDGSIYIAGFTYGSLDGQPHSGGEDAFLAKFNADGSKVWTKLLGSTSADIAYALTTGLDGSIYVTGITGASAYDSQISGTSINGQTTAGGIAVFLTKFNSDGEKIWTRLLDSSSNDIAYALTTGLDGSIYVGGYTEGVLDGQSKVGSRDGFLSKFSTDGTKAWTLLTGLSYSDYAKAIATGLDGSIYVGGLTDGSLDGRGLDSPDAFLIKYQDVTSTTTTVTSISYGYGKYFYGSSGSDKVTGTSFVDVMKQTSTISSNQLTKLSDGSWQVQNKITPSNTDNLVNVERVEFSDMSVALDVSGPAGQVAKILGSVFGQSYVSNTVFAGIGFAYLDGGMTYLDLCGLAAGAAGLTTPDLLVTTLLRNTTGTEPTALSKSSYLQSISSGASYASVVQQIADSSANAQSIKLTDLANTGLAYTPYVLPPTYSLSASTASVNEGSTAVFNLTTTNVAVGTEVSYTLSGVGTSDLTSGTLTGKASIGVGGTASISIPIAADGATEGQESLTISAQGATASIVINDTSKSIALPTYTLTPATNSVDEGKLAQVYVSTTNVAAGTSLQFGISGVGITQGDVIGGLSRSVTVDSTGKAVIQINIVADQLAEGQETMYITLGDSTTSFIINDTPLVGVPQNPEGY
jgi:uncharacterized protein (UPF0548 family)